MNRDRAKRLFIRVCLGGGYDKWVQDFNDFQDASTALTVFTKMNKKKTIDKGMYNSYLHI